MKEGHRVLTEIFGPKRDKVTRVWRILRNGELYDLYSWPNIIQIKKNEMGWAFWH
jgi:hypothetical protein